MTLPETTAIEWLKKIIGFAVVFAILIGPFVFPSAPPARAATVVIYLTSGTSWTVPADWSNATNTVEVIGGGGGGSRKSTANGNGGAGGGGGYTKVFNVTLTPSATVSYNIGTGGAGASADATAGNSGGDTYFCNSTSNCASIAGTAVVAGARRGSGGAYTGGVGGAGGASASAVGGGVNPIKRSGGAGGSITAGLYDGPGGGGAAGPNGTGAAGGSDAAGTVTTGGTGGGANGGGSAGLLASGNGGAGGSILGGGGSGAGGVGAAGAAGSAGTNGGGGGGGSSNTGATAGAGGSGGAGIEWDGTHGSGGGGGGGGGTSGATGAVGGNGGLYGGGGGGGGYGITTTGNGGNGAQGIIVITYNSNAVGYAADHSAITFSFPLRINGSLSITYNLSKGSGTFVIDDPLDPKNKLLYHSFVESPDAKNIYDGIAQLNGNGEATIKLPGYFLALNQDFRYLGTPVGQSMPGLFISKVVHPYFFGLFGTPAFTISGGAPGGRVSWQVTGIRHDKYIEENPIVPEVIKGPDTLVPKGTLLYPELYNADGTPK